MTPYSSADIKKALNKIALAILDKHPTGENLVLIGIIENGVHLAKRLQQLLLGHIKTRIPVGKLDITLFRKDITATTPYLHIQESHIPCKLKDKTVILVQDFLDYGYDISAALNALSDVDTPTAVELAVLLNTKRTRYPFMPTYEGLGLDTPATQAPNLLLFEKDGEDSATFS